MEDKKSAVEKFLEETNESESIFGDSNEQPFVEEPTKEVIPKDEPELPFHKNPKVLKFIDKELTKRLAEIQPAKEVIYQERKEENDKVGDVLTRLIGNDTPEKLSMIKEFKEILTEGTQKAKAEALAEIEARQKAESEADLQAERELENAFDNIEETFDVDITSNSPLAKKTRQEFVSFVEKIAPKDRNGDIIDYPDMTSAWETFSEIKKSTSVPSRAKELASRSMARSSEAVSETSKRPTWDLADDFIAGLGK